MVQTERRVLEVPKKDCFCFEEVLTVNELFLEQHLNNRFYCQFISEKSILTLPSPISWSWYVNIRILSADWPFLLPFVLFCIDFCFWKCTYIVWWGCSFGFGRYLSCVDVCDLCDHLSIHPSFAIHSGPQSEQRHSEFPLHTYHLQPGDTKVFPSPLTDTVSSIYPGSALGPPPGWTYPKHPTLEMPMKHPSQCPNHLNWLFSSSILSQGPHLNSKAEPRQNSEDW